MCVPVWFGHVYETGAPQIQFIVCCLESDGSGVANVFDFHNYFLICIVQWLHYSCATDLELGWIHDFRENNLLYFPLFLLACAVAASQVPNVILYCIIHNILGVAVVNYMIGGWQDLAQQTMDSRI
ncbi:hypothetical protein ACJX0J_030228 [Zea mays]